MKKTRNQKEDKWRTPGILTEKNNKNRNIF